MDVTRKVHKPDAAVHRASMADLGAKLNYHSMVSVEDMPELFVSFESESDNSYLKSFLQYCDTILIIAIFKIRANGKI